MTRCKGRGRAIGAAEDPHWFGGDLRYHPACCPACAPEARRPEASPVMVERMKRGHRRGTPRAWALRGAGG